MTLREELIFRLRQAMAVKGWNQADLAFIINTSEKHLSLVLNGKADASIGWWDYALAATLAEPTPSELPTTSKFEVGGPDPDGGLDLTDEEFAAFLKAARG